MDNNDKGMYNRNMEVLTPGEMDLQVALANYITPAPNACWADRRIPDFELIYIVAGSYHYQDENGLDVLLKPGNVLLIYPEKLHTFRRADGKGELERDKESIISCIHFEFSPRGTWGSGDYRLVPEPARIIQDLSKEEQQLIHTLFRSCSDAFEGNRPYGKQVAHTTASAIALHLAQWWGSLPEERRKSRIDEMVSWIRDHITEPISRRDLADAFCITPEHCSRIFRQELDIPVCRFIRREKVFTAYRLMHEEGLSSKETAYRLSFEDPAYFSRVFKSVMLASPKELMNR